MLTQSYPNQLMTCSTAHTVSMHHTVKFCCTRREKWMPCSVIWHFWNEDVSIHSWRNQDPGVKKVRHVFLNKWGFIFNFHQSCSQSFARNSNPNKQVSPGSLGKSCLLPSTPTGFRVKHHTRSCQYLNILFSSLIWKGGQKGRQIFNMFL